jgi:hypothetical protein
MFARFRHDDAHLVVDDLRFDENEAVIETLWCRVSGHPDRHARLALRLPISLPDVP